MKNLNSFNEHSIILERIDLNSIKISPDVKLPKNEIMKRIRGLSKGLPNIKEIIVSMKRGIYSGDGVATSIDFVTEQGNSIDYRLVHEEYGKQIPLGKLQPALVFLKNAEGQRIRYDFWGKQNDVKIIERKGIVIPSKKAVEAAQLLFRTWAKEKFKLDINEYQQSDSSNVKDYFEDNRYSADLRFGISHRTSTSVSVSINLVAGEAKLSYGRMTGGTSDSHKRNEVAIRINPKDSLENIMAKVLKNKAWKTIGADIDKSFNAYAKGFADFYRNRGQTSGVGSMD